MAGFTVLSLFHPGLPPTHDGEYHIVRFYEFYRAVHDGVLYPRWADGLNFGYGVPLFNFVYPLPNYVSYALHSFGISFIDSLKLSMVLATLIGSVFFYLWTKRFWGMKGGIIASVFYTYSPYRFLDIYVRGSVGEVWALALFPGFLWAVTCYIDTLKQRYIFISGIFLAGIVFSHNILSVMFLPFAISYIMLLNINCGMSRKLIFNAVYILFLGLALSAIFWFPAFIEKQYTVGLQVFGVKNNFPELYQLLIPSWGTGFSGDISGNQMSYQIGLANLIAVVFSIAFIIFGKKLILEKKLVIFFLCWFLVLFYLMLANSSALWNTIPLMNYFQFPWRLLSLEILVSAFLSGSVVPVLSQKFSPRVANSFLAVILFLPIILGMAYTKPAYYLLRSDSYYTTRSNFIDGTNSPGNAFNTRWAGNIKRRPGRKVELAGGNGHILEQKVKNGYIRFIAKVENVASVFVHIMFFPGWTVYIDGKKSSFEITQRGDFLLRIPKGNHRVELTFQDTFPRFAGQVISLLAVLSICAVLLRGKIMLFVLKGKSNV